MKRQAQLEAAAAWAYSSVVEHCVDIAGVASSILATPTIFPFDVFHSRSLTAPLDRFAGDDNLLNLACAFVNAEQADVAI